MKSMEPRGGAFVLLALFLFAAVSAGAEERLRVLVGVPPYKGIAEALGGDAVEVVTLLHAGESHESFAPNPSRVLTWAGADLYWATGLDFEHQWLPRLRTMAPDLEVIPPPLEGWEAHAHDDEHDHDHAHHADPHVWLDPAAMRAQARDLVAGLIRLRPAREKEFSTNLAAFERRSRVLEKAIAKDLEPYRRSRFYVYHGAFDHFADAFGLEQVALQQGSRPPSLRQLANLIEKARADGATAVFVQPQESPAAAARLAHAIGAKLVSLDPMAPAWENNLRAIAEALAADFARRSDHP